MKTYDSVFDLVPNIGIEMGSVDSIIDNDFPHISKKILLLWESQELVNYIENDLMCTEPTPDRPSRKGFPLQVLMELDIILKYHIKMFPYFKSTQATLSSDHWTIR